MAELLPYDDALKIIIREASELGTETVSMHETAGRVLAADITPERDQPPYDGSAMDGFAVRSADVVSAGAVLTVVGEIPAGTAPSQTLSPGAAMRIFTGAQMPDKADRVVIQENVVRNGDQITIADPQTGGTHVRKAGTDFKVGETLLPAGHRVRPIDINLIAAANRADASVFVKPKVMIFATGDELLEPGSALEATSIVNSTSHGLIAFVNALGGEAAYGGILPDSLEAVKARIAEAEVSHDLIITIGGASVGDYDVIKPAFRDLGAEFLFEKIAVKPGKPTWFARADNALVLGLPGNPASALVCAQLCLKPLIVALSGQSAPEPRWFKGRLRAAIGSNGPRESFLRGVGSIHDGTYEVSTHSRQDSSLLTPFIDGNVLIRRPPHAAEAALGELVDCLRI